MRRDLRAAEQQIVQLRASLNHRVRNLLSILGSVARRSAQSSNSAEDYALHLAGRIDAIARAHAALLHSPDGTVELHVLLAEELLAHAAQEDEQFSLNGPRLTLMDKAAETIWLAVHEMAVNAVKFGALSAHKGRIAIEWQSKVRQDVDLLILHWRETVPNLPKPVRGHRGFGAEIIERTLPYQLGGSGAFKITLDGADYLLEIPLSPAIGVLANTGEG